MNKPQHSLGLRPATSFCRGSSWRRRAATLGAAAALHVLPLLLLLTAAPTKPRLIGGQFGQAVSINLVSGAPSAAVAAPPVAPPDLPTLEQRLSETGLIAADPSASTSTPSTRLSDLFDAKPAGGGAAADSAALPAPSSGTGDDPFARAGVSYRGDDPAKASRLSASVQRCARGVGPARLLLIINAEGYLVARPRPIGPGGAAKLQKVLDAVERCAPFVDAATPGAPRSYEVEIASRAQSRPTG